MKNINRQINLLKSNIFKHLIMLLFINIRGADLPIKFKQIIIIAFRSKFTHKNNKTLRYYKIKNVK